MQRCEARGREWERQRQCVTNSDIRMQIQYTIYVYRFTMGKDWQTAVAQQILKFCATKQAKASRFLSFLLYIFPVCPETSLLSLTLESRVLRSINRVCIFDFIVEIWNLQRKRQFIIKLSFAFRMIFFIALILLNVVLKLLFSCNLLYVTSLR